MTQSRLLVSNSGKGTFHLSSTLPGICPPGLVLLTVLDDERPIVMAQVDLIEELDVLDLADVAAMPLSMFKKLIAGNVAVAARDAMLVIPGLKATHRNALKELEVIESE
jgi:hypothetical protein